MKSGKDATHFSKGVAGPKEDNITVPGFEQAVLFEPLHMAPSAWAGHIPFAVWLIGVVMPRTFVELGTFAGTSYFAFCQAIKERGLCTKAFAVDTWVGDAHTGYYEGNMFEVLSEHNDRLYAGFSSLLRKTFNEAREDFEEGTIDLLHIDGLHTYEAVRNDFENWLPKMSPDGIVLFHDTAVEDPTFGVASLLSEVSRRYHSFSFTHCHGLGVVMLGKVPTELRPFIDDTQQKDTKDKLLTLFANAGERLIARQITLAASQPAENAIPVLSKPKKLARLSGLFSQGVRTSLANVLHSVRRLLVMRDGLGVMGTLKECARYAEQGLRGQVPTTAVHLRKAILISGEPDTPGHVHRVERLVPALEALGWQCTVCSAQMMPSNLAQLCEGDVLYIWRAVWTNTISHIAWKARDAGALVIFDCDDLMFRPELATAELIDAIRSGKYDATKVAKHYKSVRDAMGLADALTASTRPLVAAMREFYKPSFTVPNTFGLDDYLQAHGQWKPGSQTASDGLLRIGYASGTFTHQQDFAQAAPGVATCLRKNPNVRLVLFRRTNQSMLDVSEFPSFAGLEDRIEWRPFVSLAELPSEIAKFDINLAPLEVGNPYVEAKSELKYFDAALVKVPTIASPTRPFRDAISHGVNGMLARSPEEWEQRIQMLIDDPELRQRLADTAYLHALAKYSPFARIHAVRRAFDMMSTDKEKARLAFEASLAKINESWSAPHCSAADLLLDYSSSAMPAAAVAMPVYNYADKVIEALDSVAGQSLAPLELVVVDDASNDHSLDAVMAWSRANKNRFARLKVFRNYTNSGLGATRNRAIAETDALFVLPLDADNIIDVDCLGELLKPLEKSPAAFAYPLIRKFGESDGHLNLYDWHPIRFASGNYIDAMALINKCAWADVGGYDSERTGWEDYEFYCRLAEAGYWGIRVPAARAFYRVHRGSMVHAWTENSERRALIAERVRLKHPWIDLPGY